ncbi:MAG: GreA/GreB family elongation factor [Rhizobacter sp.]|nr:GreA/GreB family elongation factor [Rhizobacter sp.]
MNTSPSYERTLTDLDHARLTTLARRVHTSPVAHEADDIESALEMARVVPSRSVAPDVVTMYSQVQLIDSASGRRYRLTVCYPADAEPAAGYVSVLSPVGASLLGLRVGATARWVTPAGEPGAAKVVAILFQPEASGDYTL